MEQTHKNNWKAPLTAVLLAVVVAGCTAKEESTPASAPADGPVAPDTSMPADAATSTPVAPPGEPPSTPFATGDSTETTTEGVPTKDADGKTIDTLAGLNRAVEYYTRVLMPMVAEDEEQAKTFKGYPPLTSLDQLVQYKVIRAIPAAPSGKKYVYDTKEYNVKLVNQ